MIVPNRRAGEYAIQKSNEIEKLIETKNPMEITLIKTLAYKKYYNEYILNNKLNYELLKNLMKS